MEKNLRTGELHLQAYKKALLFMKLSILLVLIGSLQVSAHVNGQSTVSISLKDQEISRVLNNIEKQGNFHFLYNSRLKDIHQKTSVEVNNESIQETLKKVFTGTDITYKMLNNGLIVLLSGKLTIQDIGITGKISGENGEALPNVSVSVKGTSKGTTTDNNGVFTITAPENGILVVSYIGYVFQEIKINSQSVIDVKLISSKKIMDEVVVIGYGSASKRDLTGSIVKISGKEIADKPNINPISSLQGKVAGLQVTTTGRLGEQPDVRILGTNSKTQTAPLYVVDGIFNDNIDFVNAADIESMEVLKDPSSLAIFGVRGANGVIAITTKSGKLGQLTVNFNTSVGVKKVVDAIKLTDAAGFKSLLTQQFVNDGQPPYAYWDKYTGNTNWQEAIEQTGVLNYNNVSISSGTDKNKFYMGVGYSTEQGIILHENLKKWTFTFRDELKVSRFVKLGFEVIGYQADLPKLSDFSNSISAAPIVVPFNSKFNVYNQMPFLLQDAQVDNPLRAVEEGNGQTLQSTYRTVGNVFAEINFLSKFTFKATYYADINSQQKRSYNPLVNMYNASVDTIVPVNIKTSVDQANIQTNKFQQDYLLTYANKFGGHSLTVMAGFSTVYNYYNEVNGRVSQYTTGNAIPIPNDPRYWYLDNFYANPSSRTIVTAKDPLFNNTTNLPLEWDQATVSFLARALYNYKGKYILNASYRRDGSSDISPSHRYQNFGAIGAAWEMSKEDFMQNQNIFDYLKIKGSWGILGNQYTAIHYPYEPILTASSAAVFGPGANQGQQLLAAYKPAFLADPNLRWETITSYELGFEFAILKNRLNLEANYYKKQTDNLLTSYPGANGSTPGITNAGGISNRGVELSLGWKDNFSSGFSYYINGNLTSLNNKVTSLYNNTPIYDGPSRTQVGDPIGSFFGYVVNGLYQNAADSAKYPQFSAPSKPGDLRFKDINGSGTLTDSDRVVIGNPTPKFIYGFSFGFAVKGFDFGIDFQGVSGNQIFRNWGNGAGYARLNYREARLGAWHGDATSNTEPIVSDQDAVNRENSTYMIESGSYLRIRNLQIGYNFKTSMLANVHIKSLRIYLNGQNIKTFKKNTGFTPDIGGSATQFGVDGGTYPVPAIYTAGLNVSF